MSQADENARALAYQGEQRRRLAARRSREAAMKGNATKARQLYENTRALMRSWSGANR